ncbi:MAG: hypothetical protein R3330_05895, partial [Saprospiraceae bacterium]|nr:hypothetical protein [Saprospiraceae bacterium]
TCTYQPDENIRQVARLQEAHALEPVSMSFPAEWNIAEIRNEKVTGYQCYPHRVKGEGFFVAVLRQADSAPAFKPKRNQPLHKAAVAADSWAHWLHDEEQHIFSPAPGVYRTMLKRAWEAVQQTDVLRLGRAGTLLGRVKGKDLVPDQMLALSTLVHREIPRMELSRQQALSYLRREQPAERYDQQGWILATCRGQALGWLKQTNGPLKNHYPIPLRVRMP